MPGDKKKHTRRIVPPIRKNNSKDRKKILVFTLFLRGAGVQLPPAAIGSVGLCVMVTPPQCRLCAWCDLWKRRVYFTVVLFIKKSALVGGLRFESAAGHVTPGGVARKRVVSYFIIRR